jgi:hypothetical protein
MPRPAAPAASFAAAAVVVALLAVASPSHAAKIDFETYAEGDSFKPTLTDPATGLLFYNSVSLTRNFVIEYSDASPAVPFLPGHYLVANGYSPGGSGIDFSPFGFSARPPQPVGFVSMDVAYTLNGPLTPSTSLALTGYDSHGQPLASYVVPTYGTDIQTTSLSISDPANAIASFTLSQSGLAIAVDNIVFNPVPEPSPAATLLAAATATATLPRARRRRSRQPARPIALT